jgi:hypothetical protein
MSAVPPLLVAMSGGKPRPRRVRIPVPKEIKLHVPVAELLRDHCLADWKWTHISRKAKDAREGAILKSMGAQPGWPDFMLVSPYGSVRFLELKRAGAGASEFQAEFRMWCMEHGVPHVIAWTMDQVLAALDGWRCLRIKVVARG